MSATTAAGTSAKWAVWGKKYTDQSQAEQGVEYEDVYIAKVAIAAKVIQRLKALVEASAYVGAWVIIAYSHCVEHGFDLKNGPHQQGKAVETGYWPLFRFDPSKEKGKRFKLDSKAPQVPLNEFMYKETRFTRVVKENSEVGEALLKQAQEEVDSKWERLELYRKM